MPFDPERSVLVVDDDPRMARLVTDMLSAIGIQAQLSTTYDEALSFLETEQPGLLVTDVNLDAESTGVDLAERARQLNPSAQVVVMSGLGWSQLSESDPRIGKYPFLAKPFLVDDLVAVLVSRAED